MILLRQLPNQGHTIVCFSYSSTQASKILNLSPEGIINSVVPPSTNGTLTSEKSFPSRFHETRLPLLSFLVFPQSQIIKHKGLLHKWVQMYTLYSHSSQPHNFKTIRNKNEVLLQRCIELLALIRGILQNTL